MSEMSPAESTETVKPRYRYRIPWFGGLFIAAIAALAIWDVVRGYGAAADDTDRELETQARVIAEQTARSIQAVDVVLRHVAAEYKRGRLARLSPDELHHYLRELSVGLKQIDGFGLYDADGNAVALSWGPGPSDTAMRSIADLTGFQAMRADPQAELGIANVMRADDGVWALPLGRRLEKPSGEFAGLIGPGTPPATARLRRSGRRPRAGGAASSTSGWPTRGRPRSHRPASPSCSRRS